MSSHKSALPFTRRRCAILRCAGERERATIIYYVIFPNRTYLLTMYSKSQQKDISNYEIKQLVAEAKQLEDH